MYEYYHRTNLCSKCKKEKELETKRYCRICSNAYMRKWRKTHPLSEEQKFKAIARSKLKMRVKRGQMEKMPCSICGEIKTEAPHEDYSKPYDVIWLCFHHHRELHKTRNGQDA